MCGEINNYMNLLKKYLIPVIFLIIIATGGCIYKILSTSPIVEIDLSFSDRAEIFSVGGNEAGNFLEVIFDPFKVREGENQKITVTLKNPEEIKSLKATLSDEVGFQEKEFKDALLQEEEKQVTYQLTWTPEKLESEKSYLVKFEYLTKSDEINAMSLIWHAEKI